MNEWYGISCLDIEMVLGRNEGKWREQNTWMETCVKRSRGLPCDEFHSPLWSNDLDETAASML
jgi:hypothetical protein